MSLRDVGHALVRVLPWAEGFIRKVYAWLPEGLHDTPTSRASAFFASIPAVSFIEIGANDGIAGDPIRELVLSRPGWSGVLIEPQPYIFERLKSNYCACRERLQFLNVAISNTSGEIDFFMIAPKERERLALSDWATELASCDPSLLQRHFPEARVDKVSVSSMTFAEAASLLPGGRVDLVVMDVEGHERPILETIDFDRHRVRFVIFEHIHMTQEDIRKVEARLASFGFTMKRFSRDTIAWRCL